MSVDPPAGALTQLSTVQALASGLYHGFETVGEMLRHGDFGLGTFEGLGGELMALDGEVFRFGPDGRLDVCTAETPVSFYVVTAGLAAGDRHLPPGTSFPAMKRLLDDGLKTLNVFHVLRVDGRFSRIRTRSLSFEKEPYPPLIDVSRRQPEFEFHDLEATLVGFRCPKCLSSVNLAGYHLHLLAPESGAGGHVLEFEVDEARYAVEMRPEFRLRLPAEHPAFQGLSSLDRPEQEIAEIET